MRVERIIQKGIKLTSCGVLAPFRSFVDDIVIFAPVNNESLNKNIQILIDLTQISRLKNNFHKSSLQVYANISQPTANSLASRMNILHTKSLEK